MPATATPRLLVLLCSLILFAAASALLVPAPVRAQGGELGYDQTVQGALSERAALIAYSFRGSAGDRATLEVSSRQPRFAPRLTVLDPSLRQLTTGAGIVQSTEGELRTALTLQLSEDGMYMVIVTSANSMAGDFELVLGSEGAPTITAQPPAPAPDPTASAPPDDPHILTASPVGPVVFSNTLSKPDGDLADLIEVRFPSLLTSEPQTYRFSLTCQGDHTSLITWVEIHRCEGVFEQTITLAEPGIVPVLGLPLTFLDSDLPVWANYTLTIEPVTPHVPRADSASAPVIEVYSDRVTTFASALSRPTGTQAQQVTLRFPDLINSQPQTFRYSLTCDDQYAYLASWFGGDYGNYLAWSGDRRCGDSVTETITPSTLAPFSVVSLQITLESLPIYYAYTLTIEPITPLLPVAAADGDHAVNVPVTSTTSFTQQISAPLGDRADKITVRAPALSDSAWDFTFNLLCAGTGTESVEWVIATGQILGCGDSFAHQLAGSSLAPIPALEMVISLENRTDPAHVQYTLLITPAGLPATASGPSSFVVSLTGPSQHSGALPADSLGTSTSVSVAGLIAGYPRTVGFTLACSGTDTIMPRAALQGVPGEYGCGETFQRMFATPGEQAQFTLTRTQATGPLAYLLTAAPVYHPVAPPDSDPQPLILQASETVSASGAVSFPEGDTGDTILLDARQLLPDDLPRQYTIRLVCEGTASGFVRGLTETGVLFGCGDSFEHTFATSQSPRTPLSQSSRDAAQLPMQPAAETDPLTLPVYAYLPPDSAPGWVSYVLLAEPAGATLTAPDEVLITDFITASSTQPTTYTRALSDDRHIHRLSVNFPDLAQAHWQDVSFRLTCSGVGTGTVRWLDMFGVPRACGSTFTQRFEMGSSDSPTGGPGTTLDVRLDNPGGGPIALEYTLHIEPASPYVPVVPEDTTVYQLAIALNQPTTFTQQLSSPSGNRLVRISTAVFEMIGGQAAGRDFTFWLECDGPNAGITTASGTFDGFPAGYSPFTLLCNVPVTRFIDEGAGSPPRLYIEVLMPQTPVPAYNHFTLHIIPAGAELPFDPPPPTLTPTLFMLPAITLVPTNTPTPMPVLELIAPANGAIFDTQPVMLLWSALLGDPRYEVEVQRCDLQGSACATETITVMSNSHALALAQPARVIWRVRAILPDGSLTGYSLSREFRIFLPTLPPTITPTSTPTPTATPTLMPFQPGLVVTLLPLNSATPTPTPTPLSVIVGPPLLTSTPIPTPTPFAMSGGPLVTATPTVTPIPLRSPAEFTPPPRPAELDFVVSFPLEGGVFAETLAAPMAHHLTVQIEGLAGTDAEIADYMLLLRCPPNVSAASAIVWQVDGMPATLSQGARFCEGPWYTFSLPFSAAQPARLMHLRLFDVEPGSQVPYTLEVRPAAAADFKTAPEMPAGTQPGSDLPVAPSRDTLFFGLATTGVSQLSGAISAPLGQESNSIQLYVDDTTSPQPRARYQVTVNCAGIGWETVRWSANLHNAGLVCGQSVVLWFGPADFHPQARSAHSLFIIQEQPPAPSYVTYEIVALPLTSIAPWRDPLFLPLSLTDPVTLTSSLSSPAGQSFDAVNLFLPGVAFVPALMPYNVTISCTGESVGAVMWSLAGTSDLRACGETAQMVLEGYTRTAAVSIVLDFVSTQSFVVYTLRAEPAGPPPDGLFSILPQTEDQSFHLYFGQAGQFSDAVSYGNQDTLFIEFQGLREVDQQSGQTLLHPYALRLVCVGQGASSLRWELTHQEHESQVTGVFGCDDEVTQLIAGTAPFQTVRVFLTATAPTDSFVAYTFALQAGNTLQTPLSAPPVPGSAQSTATPPASPTSDTSPPAERPSLTPASTPVGTLPLRPTQTPTVTPLPLRPTQTPTVTPLPPRPTQTPTVTPLATATDFPTAALDRDHVIQLNAGDSVRFGDDVSYPGGDTSDIITVIVDRLPERVQTTLVFTLQCAGIGTESVRWQVRALGQELTCGASVRVPFQPEANQQVVVLTFDARARQSYVTYTLMISP